MPDYMLLLYADEGSPAEQEARQAEMPLWQEFTDSLRASVVRPAPWHSGQGSEMTEPRPWQVGQVRSMEKKPCAARTRPWPSQVGQVSWRVAGVGHPQRAVRWVLQ